jgi:hypothetical protein
VKVAPKFLKKMINVELRTCNFSRKQRRIQSGSATDEFYFLGKGTEEVFISTIVKFSTNL